MKKVVLTLAAVLALSLPAHAADAAVTHHHATASHNIDWD